jgi:hypothetical protein
MPWWQLELLTIRDEHRAYLRRHLPALRADHDDLISETLLALTKNIRNHSASLPVSWFKQTPPTDKAERSRLYKLAMVILQRRVADFFRTRSSLPNFVGTDEAAEEVADPNVLAPERQIVLRRLLEVTLSVLDEMQPEDRDLVALISQEPGFRKTLNPRERKRLQRLRRRLKDEVARRLGADVADLLRISL